MKKKLGFAARVFCFLLLFGICYHVYCRWITPKFFTDTDWPTTTTFAGFYDLEKDSADVLFLGSSHGVTSFIPQEVYNQYGVTGYNLSSDQQGLVTSYYWLKEALRFQTPKAVVLECYFCFPYIADEPLNTDESYTRKALDFMRWSPVKAEAVRTICEIDTEQDPWSYYLPHLRYHGRWLFDAPDRNDYTFREMAGYAGLKGYSPLHFYLGEKGEGFEPHDMEEADGYAQMAPLMLEYLDKINDLCRENEISLILTITPAVSANIDMCNAVRAYAQREGCTFISFNEESVYRQMDYRMDVDNCDDGHPNIWGAVKVSDYIGGVLSEEFGLGGRTAPQWEETRDDYAFTMDACERWHEGELDPYLSLLDHEQYTLVITYQNDVYALEESTLEALREFGLSAELAGQDGCNYLAVVSDGRVLTEQLTFEEAAYQGSLAGGRIPLYARSTRTEWGSGKTAVSFGEEEYYSENSGLHIVVFNNEKRKMVDSRWYET